MDFDIRQQSGKRRPRPELDTKSRQGMTENINKRTGGTTNYNLNRVFWCVPEVFKTSAVHNYHTSESDHGRYR